MVFIIIYPTKRYICGSKKIKIFGLLFFFFNYSCCYWQPPHVDTFIYMCKGQRTNNTTRPIKFELNDVALFKIKNLNVFWWNASSVSNKKTINGPQNGSFSVSSPCQCRLLLPRIFFCFLILFFLIITWSCRSPLKKNSNLNRNIIKKKVFGPLFSN